MNWLALAVFLGVTIPLGAQEEFLKWDGKHAKSIALAGRVTGQAGKSLDFRITATDRSYNFKLRATWLTPATIRALVTTGPSCPGGATRMRSATVSS